MKSFAVLFTVLLVAISSLAQSKEQREAAKKWPLSFRINPGKGESKSSKSGNNSGRGTQTKTQEKTLCWTAKIDCKSTNFTEKVELKTYYVGTSDGEFAIIGSDKTEVKFDEKGRAEVEIKSPTAKLTKTTKRTGGRRGGGSMEKTVSGERLNGLVAQLLVNGTIVKTYTTQSAWAKGAWKEDLTEDDIKPGAPKKKD